MALETTTVALADGSLLRDQAFIGGRWCDADDGRTYYGLSSRDFEITLAVHRQEL